MIFRATPRRRRASRTEALSNSPGGAGFRSTRSGDDRCRPADHRPKEHPIAGSPLILCYDGSDDAKHALALAPTLLGSREALVLAVWQSVTVLPTFGWSGVGTGGLNIAEVDEQSASRAQALAEEGAAVAREAGFDAQPLVVEAEGPIWQAVIAAADERDAAAIVVGSRGLSGVRHVLLGSVSEGVVRHGKRPTLVIHRGD